MLNTTPRLDELTTRSLNGSLLTNVCTEMLDGIHTKNRDLLLSSLNFSYGLMVLIGASDSRSNDREDALNDHRASAERTTEELIALANRQVDSIHRYLGTLREWPVYIVS